MVANSAQGKTTTTKAKSSPPPAAQAKSSPPPAAQAKSSPPPAAQTQKLPAISPASVSTMGTAPVTTAVPMGTQLDIASAKAALNDQYATLNTMYEYVTANLGSVQNIRTTQNKDLTARNTDLDNKIARLENKLAKLTDKEAAYNKEFQDTVYYPRDTQPDILQDFSMGVFIFGWFLLGVLLVAFSTFQAEGSWKKGILVVFLYALITAIIFNIFYIYL